MLMLENKKREILHFLPIFHISRGDNSIPDQAIWLIIERNRTSMNMYMLTKFHHDY